MSNYLVEHGHVSTNEAVAHHISNASCFVLNILVNLLVKISTSLRESKICDNNNSQDVRGNDSVKADLHAIIMRSQDF